MKHLELFENFNNGEIASYLQKSTFDDLPINFKKGLLTYMYEETQLIGVIMNL